MDEAASATVVTLAFPLLRVRAGDLGHDALALALASPSSRTPTAPPLGVTSSSFGWLAAHDVVDPSLRIAGPVKD